MSTFLKGWSAQRWTELLVVCVQALLAWFTLDVGLWIAALVSSARVKILPYAFGWTEVGFGLMAVVVLLSVWSTRKAGFEASRGYTSVRAAYQELSEVAPGTSVVIRESGKAFLSDDEYFAALAEVRSTGQPVDSALRATSVLRWLWLPTSVLGLALFVVVIFLGATGGVPWFYPVTLVVAAAAIGALVVNQAIRARRI